MDLSIKKTVKTLASATAIGLIASGCRTPSQALPTLDSSVDTSTFTSEIQRESIFGQIVLKLQPKSYSNNYEIEHLYEESSSFTSIELRSTADKYKKLFKRIDTSLGQEMLDQLQVIAGDNSDYAYRVIKESIDFIDTGAKFEILIDRLKYRISEYNKYSSQEDRYLSLLTKTPEVSNLAKKIISEKKNRYDPTYRAPDLDYNDKTVFEISHFGQEKQLKLALQNDRDVIDRFSKAIGYPSGDKELASQVERLFRKIGVNFNELSNINYFIPCLRQKAPQDYDQDGEIGNEDQRKAPKVTIQRDIALKFITALNENKDFYDLISGKKYNYKNEYFEINLFKYISNVDFAEKASAFNYIAQCDQQQYFSLVSAIKLYSKYGKAPSSQTTISIAQLYYSISGEEKNKLSKDFPTLWKRVLRCVEWDDKVDIFTVDSESNQGFNYFRQIATDIDNFKGKHNQNNLYELSLRELIAKYSSDYYQSPQGRNLARPRANMGSKDGFRIHGYRDTTVLFIVGRDNSSDSEDSFIKQVRPLKERLEQINGYTCNFIYNSSESNLRELFKLYKSADNKYSRLLIVICGEGGAFKKNDSEKVTADQFGYVNTGSKTQLNETWLKASANDLADSFGSVALLIQTKDSEVFFK